jgi:hypothetical protein
MRRIPLERAPTTSHRDRQMSAGPQTLGDARSCSGERLSRPAAPVGRRFQAGAPVFTDPSDGSLSALLRHNTVIVTNALLTQLHLQQGDTLSVNVSNDGRIIPARIGGVERDARAPARGVTL